MLYLRKTKAQNSFSKKVIKIIILIAVIVVINSLTNNSLKSFALKITGLIWKGGNTTTEIAKTLPDNLKSKTSLIDELNELRGALENEKASNHLKVLYWETKYNEIKTIKNVENDNDSTLQNKTALIIAKPPQTARNSIAIDFNPDSLGDLNRIYYDDFIIATIQKTDHWPIVIPLYGREGEEIHFLVGEKKIPILGTGMGDGAFKSFLPIDTVITQNEPVYINNGFSEIFGFISSVEKSREGDKLIVYFRSPVNLNEIGFVEIR